MMAAYSSTEIMTENQGSLSKPFPNDAFIIAAISFYGYCISIAYEIGYNTYFHIPFYFIPFDPVSILISIFIAIGITLALLYFFNLAGWLGLTQTDRVIGRMITIFVMMGIYTAFLLYLFGASTQLWLIIFGTLALFFAVKFFLPMLTRPEEKTFEGKLLASINHDIEFNKKALLNRLQDKYLNMTAQGAIMALVAILFLAFAGGYSMAKNTTIFEIISTNPPVVILQSVGDNFIASPYNSNTHVLESKLFLISQQTVSQNSYYLSEESIGELKP